MKFSKSFFDSPDESSFRLWHHADDKIELSDVLLTSVLYKKSKKGEELVERAFYLTQDAVFYKKGLLDHKIRGVLDLSFVRMEYLTPEGHCYPPGES